MIKNLIDIQKLTKMQDKQTGGKVKLDLKQ